MGNLNKTQGQVSSGKQHFFGMKKPCHSVNNYWIMIDYVLKFSGGSRGIYECN